MNIKRWSEIINEVIESKKDKTILNKIIKIEKSKIHSKILELENKIQKTLKLKQLKMFNDDKEILHNIYKLIKELNIDNKQILLTHIEIYFSEKNKQIKGLKNLINEIYKIVKH